ncbi:unnamed protein product [Caenorhabditis sp. 36 PRJEB53466]|nr:unnamed protein product [Caenorhabditis sp. 36 PRJEB53466]
MASEIEKDDVQSIKALPTVKIDVIKYDEEEQMEEEEEIQVRQMEQESDSNSDSGSSVSSSSVEDSDDDFEWEMSTSKMKKKKRHTDDTQDSSGLESDVDGKTKKKRNIIDLEAIEKRLDRDIKRKRLLKKQKRAEGQASDDDDLICEFESSRVQKNRKRRLFRRKMIKGPGVIKRRRIKRTSVDVTADYTCDTFYEFGSTVETLTTEIQWGDKRINQNALRKVFKELNLEECESDNEGLEEEDETDLISQNLSYYQDRVAKERISQINSLKVNPFSEKLAGYNSRRSTHGPSRSLVQNYHPDSLNEEGDHKMPQALVWERPFKHLVYQSSQFDTNEETNDFLDKLAKEREKNLERELLEEVMQRVHEKISDTKFSRFKFYSNYCFEQKHSVPGPSSVQLNYGDEMYAYKNQEDGDEFNEPLVAVLTSHNLQQFAMLSFLIRLVFLFSILLALFVSADECKEVKDGVNVC